MRRRDWALPESYRRLVVSISKREIMLASKPLASGYLFACPQRQTIPLVCLFHLDQSPFSMPARILSPLGFKPCFCRSGLQQAAAGEDQNVG